MGVKIAHAMDARVVLFTTSVNKKEDALRLGADEVVVSKLPEEMAAHPNSFDSSSTRSLGRTTWTRT